MKDYCRSCGKICFCGGDFDSATEYPSPKFERIIELFLKDNNLEEAFNQYIVEKQVMALDYVIDLASTDDESAYHIGIVANKIKEGKIKL